MILPYCIEIYFILSRLCEILLWFEFSLGVTVSSKSVSELLDETKLPFIYCPYIELVPDSSKQCQKIYTHRHGPKKGKRWKT